MENALTIALSRLVAQQRAADVRAHNIANANTPGYQAERMLFSDYLVRQQRISLPPEGRVIQYVQDRATWRDTSPGPLTATGNALDLAIKGDGYFVVATPNGERFTRAGRFTLDEDGQVLDAAGNPLQGTAGNIVLPAQSGVVNVAEDGTVSTDQGVVGRLRIVRFERPTELRAEGGRLYAADAPPEEVAQPQVVQGVVEESNVRSVVELTLMMQDLREFQMASQFVEKESERLASIPDRILRAKRG